MLVAVVLPYMVLIQSALREYVYMPDIAAFFSTDTFSLSNVQAVMDGDLNGFIKSYLMQFGGE